MTRKKGAKEQQKKSGFDESLKRLLPLLPADQHPQLLSELKKPLKPAFRVNLLKAKIEEANHWAARYGWQLIQIPFCPAGFQLGGKGESISRTMEHKMGEYYIQDAASMLPVELFDLSSLSEPLILDLAASPGGKTTHLISNSADASLVIANDSNRSRIPPLRAVLQNWSAANFAITQFPGESFGQWFPELFDMVLLDAPCSMEGLRSTDAHPLRSISSRERTGLANRQAALLESALRAARVGGQIVYSTCTLAPEEDELILEQLLRKYPHGFQVESIPSRLKVDAPALSIVDTLPLEAQIKNAARIWPHIFGTAGFFAARLVKTAEIPGRQDQPPRLELQDQGYLPMKVKDADALIHFVSDQYGFDPTAWLESQHLELWQRADQVLAIPSRFLHQFPGLPFQTLGMTLAERTPEGWLLSHEYCTRFGRNFKSGRILLTRDQVPSWLKGEDQRGISLPQMESPYVLVVDELGRTLGRGKALTDRLKNLVPRRLV